MELKEFAKMIDGREYGHSIVTAKEYGIALKNRIVIVFGASDDLMEFEGAIYDEIDCFGGGLAYLNEKNLFVNKCSDTDCPYAEKEKRECKTIKAIWNAPDSPTWTYETDIPHETFMIYEDGEAYCKGIVFKLSDLC